MKNEHLLRPADSRSRRHPADAGGPRHATSRRPLHGISMRAEDRLPGGRRHDPVRRDPVSFLAFFSMRFSLRVFPAFLPDGLCGDLSAMIVIPFLRRAVVVSA